MVKIKQWMTKQDGLDYLMITEGEMPVPAEDEVLVEVRTVSLNYRDTEVVMGLYTHHKSVNSPPALVPCSDMCGVILAVGPSTSPGPLKVGDRVVSTFAPKHLTGQINAEMLDSGLGGPNPGVLTTHRVFPTYGLLKVPEYLTDEEVCTLPIASVTAWMSLNGMRPMGQAGGNGEVVLLQGTGGVSIAGLQIANAAGATTIITSSSDAKLAQAKALGATHTINYTTNPDWELEVLKITSNYGADIIFELGGARTLRKSFDCVAFGGLIDCVGYLSGKEDDPGDRLNANVLALRRNVTLKGILNGPKDRFDEMLGFYEEHGIRPAVDKVFSFEESKVALKYLFSGGHFGKVVVRVNE
ncbi:quinone reductase [Lophium mytilinum]|uniref:Quinone reductase n=1 Tax=Lophium mytilinum TaxID=390894 RepID=A0A6A6RBD0_9PEZI|nr:quinone reductase [Lophium mytilinum]